MAKFNWTKSASYDSDAKKDFHRVAKRQLKKLADDMGWSKAEYDLRSNLGGIAVSGEITLHHGDLYIQASQSSMGTDKGLMIRTCKDRTDYSGGQNHFAPLSWLDDDSRGKLVELATKVRQQKVGFNADLVEDRGYNPHLSIPRFSV